MSDPFGVSQGRTGGGLGRVAGRNMVNVGRVMRVSERGLEGVEDANGVMPGVARGLDMADVGGDVEALGGSCVATASDQRGRGDGRRGGKSMS